MAADHPLIDYFFSGAGSDVSGQRTISNQIATDAVQAAREATTAMQALSLDFVDLPSTALGDFVYSGFDLPARPVYDAPDLNIGSPPAAPGVLDVDTTVLDQPTLPVYNLPDSPDVAIPVSPQLVAPVKPDAPPTFDSVVIPAYQAEPLPTVPSLEELELPDAPVIDVTQFDVLRPDFDLPDEHIYENNLITDTKQLASEFLTGYLAFDSDSQDVRDLWQTMTQGGTGLPLDVEQALFDRLINREEASSEQAVKQAQQEWAARGFTLPGSTLLAREGEIRRQNRVERGRANREVYIQAQTQEIENLRFSVEQGVRLEGQRFEQHVRLTDAARAVVTSSYEVSRTLLSARIELLQAQLSIYQTDVQVFRDKLQIELARLEIFRTQLEAQRVKGEINQQRVAIYQAQLQGVLANVEVFRAEVEGAQAVVQAQIGQMQLYSSKVDAYRTEWEGERIKFDAYNSRVSAEEVKARVFESQVRSFAERVNAYRSQVEAAGTKVTAQTDYNQAVTQTYEAEVRAWAQEVSAKVEDVRARIESFRARVGLYAADITAEQARVEGFSRNTQLAITAATAELEATLKKADQQIEQLRLAETLGLEALRGSATVNAQLAASALSSINVSASISDQVSKSNANNVFHAYNENWSGELA